MSVSQQEFDQLKAEVERLTKGYEELSESFKKAMTTKSVRTNAKAKAAKSTEPIKGNEVVTATLSEASSSSGSSEKKPAAEKKAADKPKKLNIKAAFTVDYADKSHKNTILGLLKITEDDLKAKYKSEYDDDKYKNKNDNMKRRTEAGWVYKDYLQTNEDNKKLFREFHEKVEKGEFSDNVVEENSTEE
jgi:hypothetical protein